MDNNTQMKKLLIIGASTMLLAITGCAALSSAIGANPTPPSKAEQVLYVTQTNIVEQVIMRTNTITYPEAQVIQVTNVNNQVVFQTNTVQVIDHQIVTVTNQVATYTETVAPTTTATVNAVGAGINVAAPGVGTMVSTGLLALLALWGHLRSYKNGNTAAAVAQEVETLREFIQSLPNGTKYDTAITSWLQAHQLETGTAQQVLTLVENKVSNPDAVAAAKEISETLTSLGTAVPKA